MKINRLKHSRINFEVYDSCIMQSSQNRVYALSWYLDIFSPGWKLLMADDYSYVMPIPMKRKFLFFRHAHQPSGCQQLGVFSTKDLDTQICRRFAEAIPTRTYDLRFNSSNRFQYPRIRTCTNYVLNLNQPYSEIRKKYKEDRLRILDSAQDITFEKGEDIEPYWDFIVENCISRRNLHNIRKYEKVFKEAAKRELLEVWAAKNSKGQLESAVCIIKFQDRIYYLCPASLRQQCMTYLLDRCIQEHAGKELILDFVASSSPTSARFIESFGAVFEPYPRLKKK